MGFLLRASLLLCVCVYVTLLCPVVTLACFSLTCLRTECHPCAHRVVLFRCHRAVTSELRRSPIHELPPLSDRLKELCHLVVWDFDKTVLRIHSFGERIRAGACGVVR